MTAVNNLQTGSPASQVIAQGKTSSVSSNTLGSTSDTDTQSLYEATGSTPQTSTKDSAGAIATALKSGGNVGTKVASDFGARCQSRGVAANASSFASFASQYSAGLEGAGLSSQDADTAVQPGQDVLFSGQQVKNFTLGQSQV